MPLKQAEAEHKLLNKISCSLLPPDAQMEFFTIYLCVKEQNNEGVLWEEVVMW